MSFVRRWIPFILFPLATWAAADDRLDAVLQRHRLDWAPDPRTAVVRFEVDVQKSVAVLTGETDNPRAKADLIERLSQAGYTVRDRSTLLPDADALGPTRWGLVRVPVAALSAGPAFTASQLSQALMGTPVRLLSRQGGWYRVQLPDGYIGWMRRAQLQALTAERLAAHNRSPRAIVTAHESPVLSEKGRIVSRLPMGGIVRMAARQADRILVELPDGRRGLVRSDDVRPLERFLQATRAAKRNATLADEVLSRAHALLGQPYLWGGTSPSGMDCSGFVQLTYRLSDYWLPRDASQMAYARPRSERMLDAALAKPGDLLFFGIPATAERPERIQHVGLSLGRRRMIHSLDDVHAASLNPTDADYDAYEARRFLFALPMPSGVSGPCAQSLSDNGFFQSPPRSLTPCRPFPTH